MSIDQMTQAVSITATAEDANIELPATEAVPAVTSTFEGLGTADAASTTVTLNNTERTEEAPPEFTMPEKFQGKSAEEIARAYTELEKLRTQPEKEEVPETPKPGGDPSVIDKWSAEWHKNSSLTDEQWNQMSAETGHPIEVLKQYEAGQIAQQTMQQQAAEAANDKVIYDTVGGETQYDNMITWANSNMSPEVLNTINSMLDNPSTSKGAAEMLKVQYEEANGKEPAVTLDPSNTSTADYDGFLNDFEVLEAQRHPEYGKGGRYDMEFDRKLVKFMSK